MKITAQEEYGLRCLLQLARHHGTEPLTVGIIAEEEGMSTPYVGKLMGHLRQSGLVESVRGRSGGYVLTRPAEAITLADALEALGGSFFSSGFCDEHNGTNARCVHLGECSIRSLWGVLGDIFDRVLRRTTLADLAASAQPCESVRLGAEELEALPAVRGGRSRAIPLTTRKPS
jgi:Rrf2 family protein